MKALQLLWAVMLPLIMQAQGLAGRWQGQLSGQNGSLPSILTLKTSGNTLTGTLVVTQNGASETHQLSGQADGSTAAGTVTFTEQLAMAFEMQLTNGQLIVAIGHNGQAYLQGQYSRGNGAIKTPAPEQAQASGPAGQWEKLIRGRRLLYLYTNNGLSDEWYYDLCSNGTYVYKANSGYSSQNAAGDFSAATADGASGTWRVSMRGGTAYLVFSPRNGTPVEKIIAPRAQGEVNLDGRRYFLTQNRNCP